MIKYFTIIIFIFYIKAFSVMPDDIYKLSDIKYKGYDIYREKSNIIGFHKNEYEYNLFLENDINSFDADYLYIKTFDNNAITELKIKEKEKENQKYNIKILEINIIKYGRILNTYIINIYPALFDLEITDGYNNYKASKEGRLLIVKIPDNIFNNINKKI